MSPGVLRLLFVLCGLYALIVRTFMPLWSIPFDRSHDELPFLVLFVLTGLVQLVVTALPFPVFGWLWWRNRPRPTFTLRDGGFEVPAAVVNVAGPAVLIALMSTPGLLMVEGVPGRAEARFVTDPVGLGVSLVADALLAGIVVAYLVLAGRPRVRLTPAGLAIRTLRQREYTWDEIVPGRPSPAESKRSWVLRFPLRRVNEHGVQGLATVHAHLLHVRPEFLATAVREYADHPERRAAIGAAAELDRLRRLTTVPTTVRIGATLPS